MATPSHILEGAVGLTQVMAIPWCPPTDASTVFLVAGGGGGRKFKAHGKVKGLESCVSSIVE